jgi:hypothetical protein
LLGAIIVDQLRSMLGQDSIAFQTVFAVEAVMFLLAALVATGTSLSRQSSIGKAVQA